MTDHNKTKHASGREGCKPNGVQCLLSDEDIERLQSAVAFDGILLTRSAILSASCKHNDLPQVTRQELDRLFSQKSMTECVRHLCHQAGLSKILTKVSLFQLQKELSGTLSSHLERLRPGDVQTEVLIDWCSQSEASNSSSISVVHSPILDDGARRDNMPPSAPSHDLKNQGMAE